MRAPTFDIRPSIFAATKVKVEGRSTFDLGAKVGMNRRFGAKDAQRRMHNEKCTTKNAQLRGWGSESGFKKTWIKPDYAAEGRSLVLRKAGENQTSLVGVEVWFWGNLEQTRLRGWGSESGFGRTWGKPD